MINARVKPVWKNPPSKTVVALSIAIFYGVFTVLALALHGGDPLWFVWLGERYLDLDPNGRFGYDGQFVYYIARDGLQAAPHLDVPAYRLQRILLPLLVRLLSLGAPALIPWGILLVNFVAIVMTTYLIAGWLSQQAVSPWYAAVYGLYTGVFMAYSRDLVEPLAVLLVVTGSILWLERKFIHAALWLSLAVLAKETMLLFVVGIIFAALVSRQYKLSLIAVTALAPFLLWEAYLLARFRVLPLTAGPSLERIPLWGIIPHLTLEPGRISALLFVALPALILLPVSLYVLRSQFRTPAPWWLLLHSIFVLLMPLNVYDHIMHAGRNAGGLVVAALFLFPLGKIFWRRAALVVWVLPTLVWLVPVLRWAPWLSKI